jgi:hypothetical protein
VRGRSSRATPDKTTQSPSSQLPPGDQCRTTPLAAAATATVALCLCLSRGASLRWCSQDGSKHAVKCPSKGLRPTRLGVGCQAPALLAVGDILGYSPGVAFAHGLLVMHMLEWVWDGSAPGGSCSNTSCQPGTTAADRPLATFIGRHAHLLVYWQAADCAGAVLCQVFCTCGSLASMAAGTALHISWVDGCWSETLRGTL